MLAVVQSPSNKINQNRQAAEVRLQASRNYEANLSAGIEGMALQENLTTCATKTWLNESGLPA
jgi:uncharacterized membrane protein